MVSIPRVLHALNLDIDATLNYIRTNLPSYLEFEGWVLEQCGGELPPYKPLTNGMTTCATASTTTPNAQKSAQPWDVATYPLPSCSNHIEDWHLAHQWLLNAV